MSHWSTSSRPPAMLAAQRETEKVASAGVKRGSYAIILEELKAKVGLPYVRSGWTTN